MKHAINCLHEKTRVYEAGSPEEGHTVTTVPLKNASGRGASAGSIPPRIQWA